MNIRGIRESKKLTQVQLSDLTGIPQTTISQMEKKGIERAYAGNVRKIAKALDCAMEDLFNDQ